MNFLLLLLFFGTFYLEGSSTSTQQPPASNSVMSLLTTPPTTPDQLQSVANLFFSVFPDPATTYTNFTTFDEITTLLFETTLGLSDTTLNGVKRFYAYLKQQAVTNYLAKTPPPSSLGLTQTSIPDALTYINQKIAAAQQYGDTQGVTTWQANLATLQTAITTLINGTIASSIIPLAVQTDSWQNYLKVLIANSFSYEQQLLSSVVQDQIQMFNFLPQLETAYFSDVYEQVRANDAYVRTFLVITDILRSRALTQCSDWSTITDQGQLFDTIETFKEGDFYTFAQSFQKIATDTTTTPLVNPISSSSPSLTINPGYTSFFTIGTNSSGSQVVQPLPAMATLFSMTGTTPALTALGAFLLTEGTITDVTGKSYPGLQTNANFTKLFSQKSDGSGYQLNDLYLELLAFSGINILSNAMAPLFNSANLAATMNALNTMLTNNPSLNLDQFPSILLYKPEDQLFLEQINTLAPRITNQTTQSTTPASFWDSIADAFTSLADELVSDVTQIGSDLWQATQAAGDVFVSLGYAAMDGGMMLYYESGIGCAVENISYTEATERASGYMNDVGHQIDTVGSDAMNIVGDVTDVVQQVVSAIGSTVGQCLAVISQDPQLGKDISGLVSTVGKVVIDLIRDATDFVIQLGTSIVKLTVEAIGVIANSLSEAYLTASGNAMDTNFQYFIRDIVSSILSTVTIFMNALGDVITNIMTAIAYLIASIVDLIADVSGFTAALAVAMTGGSFTGTYESVQNQVNQHRGVIASTVTTAIMVAAMAVSLLAAPVTVGGLALGVMGAAMMLPSIIGSNQQDMAAIDQQQKEETFLAEFTNYINQCQPAQTALQGLVAAELTIRLNEQLSNTNRGAVTYQNYLNNSINTTRNNQAYQLGSFYNLLLTPDTQTYPGQTLAPGDAGYSYGIQTNRFDLNPSQGFRVYSKARGTFAQEIATQPAPLTPPNPANSLVPGTIDATQTTVSHFITQKDLSNIPGAATGQQKIVIRWRVIYESGSDFYIGIYYNQNYIDPSFLLALNTQFEKAAQSIATNPQQFSALWAATNAYNNYLYNFDSNAKAFVCYQNSATNNQPSLGVYEHSPMQFVVANQYPSQSQNWFKNGTWYLMTLSISGSSVTATFDQEGTNTLHWQTTASTTAFTAANTIPYQALSNAIGYRGTTSYAGSFGVITSGAAVEYQILTPAQTVTETTQRTAAEATLQKTFAGANIPMQEVARQQQWTKQTTQQLSPTFGSLKLTPYSYLTTAQGINVYTTQAGTIQLPANMFDYLVTLQNPPAVSATPGIGSSLMGANLGQPITNSTQYLVSLVSGACYTTKGTVYLTYPDALIAYTALHGSLPKNLINSIFNTQQMYQTQQSGTIAFQNVVVKAATDALQKNVPLYSCPSFNINLPGTDYLIFVSMVNNQPGAAQSIAPLSSSNTINAAISLITGTVYAIFPPATGQQVTQLPQGPLTSLALGILPSNAYPSFGQLATSYLQTLSGTQTATAMQNQITVYTNYQKLIAQQLQAQQQAAATTAQTTGTLTQPAQPTQPKPLPQRSLQQLLSNSTSFGGFTG